MAHDVRLAILHRALAVAYNAKAAETDLRENELLQQSAEEHLPEDDQLRSSIELFLSDARVWSRDPVKLSEAGETLRLAVEFFSKSQPSFDDWSELDVC